MEESVEIKEKAKTVNEILKAVAKTAEAFVEIMEETKKERAETAASWSIASLTWRSISH